MARPEKVAVGTAIAVVDETSRRVLILKRQGAHQAGKWAFPGGWVDLGDKSIADTCRRELEEEVGLTGFEDSDFNLLEVTTEYHSELDIRTVTIYNLVWYHEDKHGIPEIKEPHKCSRLEWIEVNEVNFPEPAFPKLNQAWDKLCEILHILNLVSDEEEKLKEIEEII